MNLLEQIKENAKKCNKRIVLPEGTEERTLKAANQILTDGVADLILLGNPDEIMNLAKEWGLGNMESGIPRWSARRNTETWRGIQPFENRL